MKSFSKFADLRLNFLNHQKFSFHKPKCFFLFFIMAHFAWNKDIKGPLYDLTSPTKKIASMKIIIGLFWGIYQQNSRKWSRKWSHKRSRKYSYTVIKFLEILSQLTTPDDIWAHLDLTFLVLNTTTFVVKY